MSGRSGPGLALESPTGQDGLNLLSLHDELLARCLSSKVFLLQDRVGPLPLVCKCFHRLLSDPNDRHLWSEMCISDSFGAASEHSLQRFLKFLRSHLPQVEVADLRQLLQHLKHLKHLETEGPPAAAVAFGSMLMGLKGSLEYIKYTYKSSDGAERIRVGFPRELFDCTRLTSVQLIAGSKSSRDMVSFGSLSGELGRMSALRQLRISNCEVRGVIGTHRLTSLEHLQISDSPQGRQFGFDIGAGLQLPTLPPRLATLVATTVIPSLWEAASSTALTALHLGLLAAALVQPALEALQQLPLLHSFSLTRTRGVAEHLDALATGGRIRSLGIVHCGLQQLPESLGVWAAKLTHLDLSNNDLTHFPACVRGMLQLEVLDLSYNESIQLVLPPAASETTAWKDCIPYRRQNNTVAELLNDARRCLMRVLALNQSSDRWSYHDMRCVSAVHAGSGSSSAGGGVARWVFRPIDAPRGCLRATIRKWWSL